MSEPTNRHQELVSEFMRAFGQNVPDIFSPIGFPGNLRASLIEEEAKEFAEAVQSNNYIGVIDAICDLLYVTYGAASALGIDISPFFEEVHRSNMSKLGTDGKPIYREDGKVVKPPHWSPPRLGAVLAQQLGVLYAQNLPDAAS